MDKSLTIKTHQKDVEIDYIGDDLVKIKLRSDLALCVEFDKNVLLHSKGDFVISSQGEINLVSQGRPICIDSIGSEIHLNSRASKFLKEFRIIDDGKIIKSESKSLEDRVVELESQLKSLLKILEIKVK